MKTEKLTNEEFISKVKEIHGDKYDYSNTLYKDNRSYVRIICPEHGEFKLKPKDHLNGVGCPECAKEPTTEDFISMARKIHGDKYDYSKVDYKKPFINVIITCPIHGDFKQRPAVHLSGRGCAECFNDSKNRLAYCPNEFYNKDNVSVGEFKTIEEMMNFPIKDIWDINRTKSNKFNLYRSNGMRFFILCNWCKKMRDPKKYILIMKYKSGKIKCLDTNNNEIEKIQWIEEIF